MELILSSLKYVPFSNCLLGKEQHSPSCWTQKQGGHPSLLSPFPPLPRYLIYHSIYLTHLLLSIALSCCNPVSTTTHWGTCISLTDLPASCPFQFIVDLESEWSFNNTKLIQSLLCLKNISGFPLLLGWSIIILTWPTTLCHFLVSAAFSSFIIAPDMPSPSISILIKLNV